MGSRSFVIGEFYYSLESVEWHGRLLPVVATWVYDGYDDRNKCDQPHVFSLPYFDHRWKRWRSTRQILVTELESVDFFWGRWSEFLLQVDEIISSNSVSTSLTRGSLENQHFDPHKFSVHDLCYTSPLVISWYDRFAMILQTHSCNHIYDIAECPKDRCWRPFGSVAASPLVWEENTWSPSVQDVNYAREPGRKEPLLQWEEFLACCASKPRDMIW